MDSVCTYHRSSHSTRTPRSKGDQLRLFFIMTKRRAQAESSGLKHSLYIKNITFVRVQRYKYILAGLGQLSLAHCQDIYSYQSFTMTVIRNHDKNSKRNRNDTVN